MNDLYIGLMNSYHIIRNIDMSNYAIEDRIIILELLINIFLLIRRFEE